ncbi:hypothetical protein ZWY2020_000378 [Hordeum vulgare]|nr:hypothetical protein ZWY2020_000378 [Hordeum vulgare]
MTGLPAEGHSHQPRARAPRRSPPSPSCLLFLRRHHCRRPAASPSPEVPPVAQLRLMATPRRAREPAASPSAPLLRVRAAALALQRRRHPRLDPVAVMAAPSASRPARCPPCPPPGAPLHRAARRGRLLLLGPRPARHAGRPSTRGHIDGTERNRASPQAICKLYKHINEDQRAAIRDMGTGAFLDIKCGYLHNTLVTWFPRQYHSGRKGFVVPRRGFIPLTEESVHKILGIPRGDIEIKYEADYDNEDEIASSLFPGDGSRPKITTVATAIINNNNNGDASFKKLWLIYIVSTLLAPTTDTRINNKCYPMLKEHIDQANRLNLCKFVVAQLHEHLSKGKFTKGCLLYCMLWYLDALDCDSMELELPNTPYTINAWSKTHVDVVAEMDMLEHDPPSFGNFQDKLKATTVIGKFASGVGTLFNQFASGVDTLLTELTQAANANKRSHGSSSDKARDNRPGAFTPPSFSLGLSPIPSNPSNEVNIDYEHLDAGNPLEIMPISWAQPTVVETGLQMVEYPLSDKLTAFLATGDQDEIDADLAEELDDYERHLEDFFKKKRAAATTAGAARSNNMAGETGVQSVTPKTNPHKERVKKLSRFKLSPYDDDINVTSEEEDIYKKLMLSRKYKKNGNSSIKK